MWRDNRSTGKNGTGCKWNFCSGISFCFLVLICSSCSFQLKTDVKLIPPIIYVCRVIGKCKKLCVNNKLREGWLSHTLISPNWASGETFVHLQWRERYPGETISLGTHSVSYFWIEFPAFFTLKLLEARPPHIYVRIAVCNWKESMFSEQAMWRAAFIHTYLSDLSMCRNVRSTCTKGTGHWETLSLVSQSVS